MVEKIKIFNFQSHTKSELKFVCGVNSIIGQSDSGKSAILRALNWVINNKPRGDAFITHGHKEVCVELYLKNYCVSRIKSDSVNSYCLNAQEYKAFNHDVPDEINNILNFSELNIQYQQDKPFLLSESSGEVSRVLNKIIDLQGIETALSNIEKIKRNYKNKKENYKKNIEKIEKDIERYNFLSEFEIKLNDLIEKEKNYNKKLKNYEFIRDLLEKIRDLLKKISKIKTILNYEHNINSLIEKNKKTDSKKEQKYKLEKFIYSIKKINNTINQFNFLISFENKIKKLNEINKIIINKNEKNNKLKYIINLFLKTDKEIKKIQKKIKEDSIEYDQLFGDKCPLCGKAK